MPRSPRSPRSRSKPELSPAASNEESATSPPPVDAACQPVEVSSDRAAEWSDEGDPDESTNERADSLSPDHPGADAPPTDVPGDGEPTWPPDGSEFGPDPEASDEGKVLAKVFGAPKFGDRDPREAYVTATPMGGVDRERRSLQLAADSACALIQAATARALRKAPADVTACRTVLDGVLFHLTGAKSSTRAQIFLQLARELDPNTLPGLWPWDATSLPREQNDQIWIHFLDLFPEYEKTIVDSTTGEIKDEVRDKYARYLWGVDAAARGRPPKVSESSEKEPIPRRIKAFGELCRLLDTGDRVGPENRIENLRSALTRIVEHLRDD